MLISTTREKKKKILPEWSHGWISEQAQGDLGALVPDPLFEMTVNISFWKVNPMTRKTRVNVLQKKKVKMSTNIHEEKQDEHKAMQND